MEPYMALVVAGLTENNVYIIACNLRIIDWERLCCNCCYIVFVFIKLLLAGVCPCLRLRQKLHVWNFLLANLSSVEASTD
ncbi:MAG: hypothetical protein ACKPKO_20695, partial [Candidatus Fonsibacter sp.]